MSGNIPVWAVGSLFRTGPGVYKVEGTPVGTFYTSHWFDGLAHTHRFDITPDGEGRVKVFYSSRRQSNEMMEHIRASGDRKFFSFGQRRDPCLGMFAKIMSSWRAMRAGPDDKSIENISVVVHTDMPGLDQVARPIAGAKSTPPDRRGGEPPSHGGHRACQLKNVWITTDNSGLKKIDPDTLEPIGFVSQQSLHPDLSGPTSCAHAQRDPITGDMFNFNLQMGRTPTYRIFRVSASTGKTDILATIGGPGIKAGYLHSFYISPSFVILCLPSSHLGLNGLKVVWERNIIDAIEPFDTTKKCKWFIVDRLHGKGVVGQFETDAGFFFHTVNAFEERDLQTGTTNLFCDVVEYPNLDVMFSLYYDVLLGKNDAHDGFWQDSGRAQSSLSRLARYHIKVPSAEDEEAALSVSKTITVPAPHSGELPTINPLFALKRQRYVYGLAFFGRSTLSDSLVKTDMETKEALFWNIPPGHTPGEAIFVARPDGEEEDDGVLLSVVLDGKNRTSYLVCLDAKTMSEMGRADVGFAIGFGFHGAHVSSGGHS